MPHRILVVDDEPHIREVICFALEKAGMTTITARNGKEALTAFRRGGTDMIVLDIGMPEMDGLDVCRQVRMTSNLPILFLSARDDEIDRILGLELGADDYVTKPFSPRELVARTKAILKRSGGGNGSVASPMLSHGSIRLDRGRHSVSVDDQGVDLTGLEFAILEAFLARPDMVFSRESLISAAYGPSAHVADRTVDSHVRNIRAKFAATGREGIITTVHGVGFRLAQEDI